MDFSYTLCVIVTASLLQNCIGQTVGFEIKITPEQTQQQYRIGVGRVLKCMASVPDNDQRPTIHWEINGVQVTATDKDARIRIEEENDGGLMLRVETVQDGDEGTYKCVATLGSQTDSRSCTVLVVQDLKVLSSTSQFGIFGTDGAVKCEAVAKPAPTSTWKFNNGTKIQSGTKYIIQQDQMIIKDLNDGDTAKYLCDIVVIEVGDTRAFIIDYQVVRLPKIDMIPTISPNNPKVGDPEVKITCHATGFPQPTYEYKKGANNMPEAQVDKQSGILTINDLKREDEGVYTCVAKNRGGSDEKSNHLDVKIIPIIDEILDVKDAVEGGQQKVTCMASGDPAPTVLWQKQGQAPFTTGIKESGPTIIAEAGTDRVDAEIKRVGLTMEFTYIKPQDAGTYICNAINTVGNASKTIKFEVRYKPNFDTDYKVKTFYGWRGSTANLTCLASANEVATIKWYEIKDNRTVKIENEAPYTMSFPQVWPEYYLSSSSLMVVASDDDSLVFKDYTCEATNSLGSANQTVTLKKALVPGQPVVRVASTLSTKVTVEIDIPKDNGGQPVTGYHYSYHVDTEVTNPTEADIVSTRETTVLELKDLKPNTQYLIRVRARNAVGLGSDMSVSFHTKEVSKPVKLELLSPAEGPEPTSYTLKWADVDDGGSPVIDIVIKYRRILVTGTDSQSWKFSGDVDKSFTIMKVPNVKSTSYTLSNLERDTYYDIRIMAINKEGESPETFQIIRTSQGGTDGSSVVIAIVVSLIVFILVVAIIIFLILKRKPELVDRLKRKRGEGEGSVKREAGKDLNDHEQLIDTDNATRIENEVKAETQTGNCASVCKSESKVTANDVHKDGSRNKYEDPSALWICGPNQTSGLNSSAAGTKIIPATTAGTQIIPATTAGTQIIPATTAGTQITAATTAGTQITAATTAGTQIIPATTDGTSKDSPV